MPSPRATLAAFKTLGNRPEEMLGLRQLSWPVDDNYLRRAGRAPHRQPGGRRPFSGWDQVFPEAAMTLAAVDRLVHHSTIIELNVESYRRRAAATQPSAKRKAAPEAS